jgi:hypothetical protein
MVVNEFVEARIALQLASAAGRRRSFWEVVLLQFVRMRFQLVGGFLLAVSLPGAVANRMSWASAFDFTDPTFVGTMWAFLLQA